MIGNVVRVSQDYGSREVFLSEMRTQDYDVE